MVDSRAMEPLKNSRNLYHNTDTRLVVTGQGRDQCADTLSRIPPSWVPEPGDLWLNFGLAGAAGAHGKPAAALDWRQPGQVALAEAIEADGTHWTLDTSNLPVGSLDQVDRVDGVTVRTKQTIETEFRDPVLYDMEASEIARLLDNRGALKRLVVIKLIADGPGLTPSQRLALGNC